MKSKLSILVSVIIVITLSLASGSCLPAEQTPTPTPPTALPTGIVEVHITDAPPRTAVTSILITVSKVEIHKAVAEQEQEQQSEGEQIQEQEQEQQQVQQGEGEWLPLDIIYSSNTFDLIKIKGLDEVFAISEVEAGKYTQIRLTIDKAEVALEDEELQEATVPSGKLRFVRPFDVVADETTTILLDFDAEKSVTVTGNGKILVKPVIKITVWQGNSTDEVSQEGSQPQTETGEQVSVDDSYNGKEVEINVGDLLIVSLESNPTTGFRWELAEISDTTVLELVENEYEAGGGAKQNPPVAGAGGKEIWTFKALEEGTTKLSMEYSRPWKGGEKAVNTFVLTVVVK